MNVPPSMECKDHTNNFNRSRNTKGTRRRYKFKPKYDNKHGRFRYTKSEQEQGFNKNISKSIRKHNKIHQNKTMHGHINYFKNQINHNIPDEIIPHILNISDYSNAFYYENYPNKSKKIIYCILGNFSESGEPRFVFINKYDINSDTFITIASLECNKYFNTCPLIALQQNGDLLHLIGNSINDFNKHLLFSLRANKMIRFNNTLAINKIYKRISMSFILNNNYNDNKNNNFKLMNKLNTKKICNFKNQFNKYNRFLYVNKLNRVLRFGIGNKLHFMDCNENMNGECVWKKYKFLLPGNALSMHFIIGYDCLLYIFDVKGGGNGKMWIIDLLFNGNIMERCTKNMDTWFYWDYCVKISRNYVKFMNSNRWGDMIVGLKDIMPPTMIKYYDYKTKLLVNGFCNKKNKMYLNEFFPVCLIGLIYEFYQPFF